MNVKCLKCGVIRSWRNQRGAKMPKTCMRPVSETDAPQGHGLRVCGGEMVKCDHEGNPIVPKPQPKRRKTACEFCARGGMVPGSLRELTSAETFLIDHPEEYAFKEVEGSTRIFISPTRDKITMPENTIVCCWHESYEKRSNFFAGEGCDAQPYPILIRPNPSRADVK